MSYRLCLSDSVRARKFGTIPDLTQRILDSSTEAMSASESDTKMVTQESPYNSAAEERMLEGEMEADVERMEMVEVEVLVKEGSPVEKKELKSEVKKFLRSGVARRYLTGYFKTSGKLFLKLPLFFILKFPDFGSSELLSTHVNSLLVSQEEEASKGSDLTVAPLNVR